MPSTILACRGLESKRQTSFSQQDFEPDCNQGVACRTMSVNECYRVPEHSHEFVTCGSSRTESVCAETVPAINDSRDLSTVPGDKAVPNTARSSARKKIVGDFFCLVAEERPKRRLEVFCTRLYSAQSVHLPRNGHPLGLNDDCDERQLLEESQNQISN